MKHDAKISKGSIAGFKFALAFSGDNPQVARRMFAKLVKSRSPAFKRDFKAEAKIAGFKITAKSIASFKRSMYKGR